MKKKLVGKITYKLVKITVETGLLQLHILIKK